MTDWKGQTVDGTFAVQLQAPVLRALDGFCREVGSSETGGILIGRYSVDLSVAIVREATPPPSDSRRGRSWFVRGVRGLRDLLDTKWRAKERTHYVGEWHFHPVDHVEPSDDDFQQMLEIGRAKQYECKEPLLLIIGTGQRQGLRSFRAFVCPAGRTPLELLPPADSAEAAVIEPQEGQAR
jgi:integrative and conjugative element protein (TIGR02256 family)